VIHALQSGRSLSVFGFDDELPIKLSDDN